MQKIMEQLKKYDNVNSNPTEQNWIFFSCVTNNSK